MPMPSPEEGEERLVAGIIRLLKGDGDLARGTVIVSASTVDEAVGALNAGADGIMVGGRIIFRDELMERDG